MKKYRFKLLQGRHTEGGKAEVVTKGQTFESDIELDRRFGSDKFQRLESGTVMEDEPPLDDGLDNMSLEELRALAQEEGIDLTGLRTKAQVKDALRAASSDEE